MCLVHIINVITFEAASQMLDIFYENFMIVIRHDTSEQSRRTS